MHTAEVKTDKTKTVHTLYIQQDFNFVTTAHITTLWAPGTIENRPGPFCGCHCQWRNNHLNQALV